MMKHRLAKGFFFLLLVIAGLTVFFTSLTYGLQDFSWDRVLSGQSSTTEFILLQIRLPRVLQAFFVGGALALAGYLLQILVNNPLADPYLLGTASGASFGANLVFCGYIPLLVGGVYMPPLVSFIFAGMVTLAVMLFSYRKGNFSTFYILLSGVAMTSFFGALISITTYLSSTADKMRTIIYWSMGSFEKADWATIQLVAASSLLVLVYFFFSYKELNIYMLGEERAASLGVNTSRLKIIIILSAILLVGLAVSGSGPIGFVGLIIPHFVRAVWGAVGKFNTSYTFVIGAFFMVACDLLARIIYEPVGLPVGVVSSFVGIPFFVYLLRQKNYRFSV